MGEPIPFIKRSTKHTYMHALQKEITTQIKRGRIKWQRHAFERMLERDISRSEVIQVLLHGELIENYPADNPFSSGLFLGFNNEIPLHVVAAIDREEEWCYIVTAYHPDENHFEPDYKTRKK